MKTQDEYILLLKKAGCDEKVIQHCIAVRDLSLIYAKNAGADIELVNAGALLHDIGRSQTHSVAHGQIGADISRRFGISEEICLIIERHVGAGLSAEECREYGLVPKDCIPLSPEEKIVAHCDNLIKGTKVISVEERLSLSSKLNPDAIKRLKKLSEEIEKFSGKNTKGTKRINREK
ncbi:HDIG domain-containing protein [Methanomicrobium antiquum]|uniref:HDIG domain-containing protein n=1 Tax=Methanomicrobium antiquum TaxID=487686 RepID=A0AAF0FSH6_9EURY|nr:HDIG domain-containing metalloprotein [Methanomicrobium antiquum]WFN37802.1 HDIG domain-containing protein [Methanomicrobium antiquum]